MEIPGRGEDTGERLFGRLRLGINYNLARHCVELELDRHLDDEKLERMTSQFTLTADYEGEGEHGSLFALYP